MFSSEDVLFYNFFVNSMHILFFNGGPSYHLLLFLSFKKTLFLIILYLSASLKGIVSRDWETVQMVLLDRSEVCMITLNVYFSFKLNFDFYVIFKWHPPGCALALDCFHLKDFPQSIFCSIRVRILGIFVCYTIIPHSFLR
jgi:hypothetical protein